MLKIRAINDPEPVNEVFRRTLIDLVVGSRRRLMTREELAATSDLATSMWTLAWQHGFVAGATYQEAMATPKLLVVTEEERANLVAKFTREPS